MTNRQSDGKSFAYLLGVYLGDGCVTFVQGYYRFRLNTIDQDFAEATVDAIKDVTGEWCPIHGPYQDKRFSKSAPQFQICSLNQEMCKELMSQTESKRVIPDWIHAADKDVRLAFIAGLMDSEGFVAENKNPTNRRFYMGFKSCDTWVPEFVRLLEKTGIRIGKLMSEEPRKPGYKTPWSFRVKMQSWIDSGAYFRCSRKQSRVEKWAEFPAYSQRKGYPQRAYVRAERHDVL